MPTPAEKKALYFLAGVVLLGAGVRAAGAVRQAPAEDAVGRRALHRQVQAVDSVRRSRAGSGRDRGAKSRLPTGAGRRPGATDGGASGPVRREARVPTSRGPDGLSGDVAGRAVLGGGLRGVRAGVPVPTVGQPVIGAGGWSGAPGVAGGGALVDLDRASAEEIERLPRVGPVLARRIVADRDSLGPFGSIEELGRVRGVGPGLATTLAGRVTFSGSRRRQQDTRSEGGTRRRHEGTIAPGAHSRRPRPPGQR